MPAAVIPPDELKAQLEKACDDLWWSSESDYPVEVLWHEAATQPLTMETTVRQLLDCELETTLQMVDFADFFERSLTPKSWHTAEDTAQLTRLKHLKDLLSNSLTHLRVYRCGEVTVRACVVGMLVGTEGVIAGISTTLVET